MALAQVATYDTTLRDGLRNSGIELSVDERVALARQLEASGVDALEVGYGGPAQVEVMARIAEAVTGPAVYGLSRVNRADVDRVLAGVGAARRPGVNIYQPTSAPFLASLGISEETAVERTVAAIRRARQHVDLVMYATQDASRSDAQFLITMCSEAIAAGATAISVSDTVSHALPQEFGGLCARLVAEVPGASGVTWSVHCHNAIGLAVANCLAAVANGATMVECTVNGIGEGAGNAPLQTVVAALNARADTIGAAPTGIDTTALGATAALLDRLIANPA